MHYLGLKSTRATLAANLAVDEALLEWVELHPGASALRLWELPHYGVVLGASSRIASDIRESACAADAIPVSRRSSGGGTVVLGPGALNITLVMPINATLELRSVDTAQRYVLQRLADQLAKQAHGLIVEGLGDLAINRRKFAGSAQRRLRNAVMVHASILYDFDLERVERYLAIPERQPPYRAGRPHLAFLQNLSIARPALVALVRSAWLADERHPSESPRMSDPRIQQLIAEKYENPAWIRRF